MKMNRITVVLMFNKLNISQKIIKARNYVDNIIANPLVFTNPNPPLNGISNAIDDLEIAQQQCANGDKVKVAIMHDKETVLMKMVKDLGHYVESITNGDETIVHLAGMEIKKPALAHHDDFEVVHAADRGAVRMRVKAATVKTIYRWEYNLDPIANINAWVVMKHSAGSTTNFGDLTEGIKYWFRVVFINNNGESTPYEPISLIVI